MENVIGRKVRKFSGNPFKSGFKVNTIKGIVRNEYDDKHRLAYTFNEDDSYVNCDMCEIIE